MNAHRTKRTCTPSLAATRAPTRGDPEGSPDYGLGLPVGAPHYRAYVGAPEIYDLVAAMTFNLLTCLGLRQHHRVLDIGCGSLRVGRLLIPYLNRGNYTGLEPNAWLVEEGIRRETGADLIRIKESRFIQASDPGQVPPEPPFDLAFAQSVFSHAPLRTIRDWFDSARLWLAPDGLFAATYFEGPADHEGDAWLYPGIARYTRSTLAECARSAGLRFLPLDWRHPKGQQWIVLLGPHASERGFASGRLHWNRTLEMHPEVAAPTDGESAPDACPPPARHASRAAAGRPRPNGDSPAGAREPARSAR
jgi:SAM-dependent methyltransferase